MIYSLRIDDSAERDLEIIHEYLLQHAGPQAAHRLLDQLVARAKTLVENPLRGALVTEVTGLSQQMYRQVHSPPWRLIYAVHGSEVVILVVADGRRDLNTLLVERLLG